MTLDLVISLVQHKSPNTLGQLDDVAAICLYVSELVKDP